MPGRGYGINRMASSGSGELFNDVQVIKSTIVTIQKDQLEAKNTLLAINKESQTAKSLADQAIADTVSANQANSAQMEKLRNTIIQRLDPIDQRIGRMDSVSLELNKALTEMQLSANRHESALSSTSLMAIETKHTVIELVEWRDVVVQKLERTGIPSYTIETSTS